MFIYQRETFQELFTTIFHDVFLHPKLGGVPVVFVLEGECSVTMIDAKLSTATNPANFHVSVEGIPLVVVVVHVDVSIHHQVGIDAFAIVTDPSDIPVICDQSDEIRIEKSI